jgi:hypothetical protein
MQKARKACEAFPVAPQEGGMKYNNRNNNLFIGRIYAGGR